jgi:hypothetical protein
MNLGSWFRSSNKLAGSSASVPDESASRIEYVDALLNLMLKKSLFNLRLTASAPLPCVEENEALADDPPNYQAVINRLKVMSRLNPVLYSAPVQGKIEIKRGPHVLVYETHFDDKSTSPSCVINLRIRQS